jgi:NAD(P)-dependent dehydrogenase (short-subunit alcohol dehydrogenase family)
VTAHYADVSDPVSVEACIAEIVAEHGRIDNLVTSAGFTENFEAVAYPIERMRKLWGVNVDGTYLFATSVARHLVRFCPIRAEGKEVGNKAHWLTHQTTRWAATLRAAWSLLAA